MQVDKLKAILNNAQATADELVKGVEEMAKDIPEKLKDADEAQVANVMTSLTELRDKVGIVTEKRNKAWEV